MDGTTRGSVWEGRSSRPSPCFGQRRLRSACMAPEQLLPRWMTQAHTPSMRSRRLRQGGRERAEPPVTMLINACVAVVGQASHPADRPSVSWPLFGSMHAASECGGSFLATRHLHYATLRFATGRRSAARVDAVLRPKRRLELGFRTEHGRRTRRLADGAQMGTSLLASMAAACRGRRKGGEGKRCAPGGIGWAASSSVLV